MAGNKSLWRLVTRLLADGVITVQGSTTVDIKVETEDATAQSTGHAFYALDAYDSTGTVKVFPLNDGLIAPGTFDIQASVGYFREYVAGPPPSWVTWLRFTNLFGQPADIHYKLYRWLGLD